MLSHNQDKVSNAIRLLKGEIDTRKEVIVALQEALDALLLEATGSASEEMTKEEVLIYLDVSSTSLGRYMSGRVPGCKPDFPLPISSVGRSHRWRRADIYEWKTAYLYPTNNG
jgi:predicted DNA-binding transcriptional regulator AlpA